MLALLDLVVHSHYHLGHLLQRLIHHFAVAGDVVDQDASLFLI